MCSRVDSLIKKGFSFVCIRPENNYIDDVTIRWSVRNLWLAVARENSKTGNDQSGMKFRFGVLYRGSDWLLNAQKFKPKKQPIRDDVTMQWSVQNLWLAVKCARKFKTKQRPIRDLGNWRSNLLSWSILEKIWGSTKQLAITALEELSR